MERIYKTLVLDFNSNASLYIRKFLKRGDYIFDKEYAKPGQLLVGFSWSETEFSHINTKTGTNAIHVTQGGYTFATDWQTSGANYTEFVKEWADGNLNNEDKIGYMVTIKNNKLEKANENDHIIGATSGNPAIVGNADESYYWQYERDAFNRIIYEGVPGATTALDDEGNEITITSNGMVKQPKINPNYNPSLRISYIARADCPEWDYVGMRGIILVRDDWTCAVGEFCKCGGNGIVTHTSEQSFNTYYAIERISKNTVSMEVK